MRIFLTLAALFAGFATLILPLRAEAQVFQPEALAEDFAVLRAAIEEGHPGALRYTSAEELSRVFDAAAAGLDQPMDARALFVRMAPVVAALRDGHTSLDLSEADSAAFREQAQVLPLKVFVRDGRLFVLRDLSVGADGHSVAGREILSINGADVRDVLAQMMRATPGDGAIVSGREQRLSKDLRFNRLYALLVGPAPRYRIELRGRFGSQVRTVEGMTLAALDEAWAAHFPQDRAERPVAEISFRNDGVAVLTVRSFEGYLDEAREQRLDSFFAETFTSLRERATRALVLDVRDNGGGQDELGRQLFAYLAERPFNYYSGLYVQSEQFSFFQHSDPPVPGPPPDLYERDAEGRLRWREHANYGLHEPEANRFAGPVYILMNGGSYSTTAEFLSVAHANRRAVFIGEEAGGGYYGNTSGLVLTVTLPNSGLRLRLPVQRYELAVAGFAAADHGVPPDHAVLQTAADFLAGRDRAMELALRLARQRE